MTSKNDSPTMTAPQTQVTPTANQSVDLAAKWAEARLSYPLYAALAAQFQLAPPLYSQDELPPTRPTRAIFDRDLQWLESVDQKLLAYQIRQLPPQLLNANEQNLRAFIQRQLKKPDKTNADRDKIDLLLVQYFALCAPDELVRQEISLDHVARVLQPVLTEADPTPLEWCQPLEEILAKLSRCQSLRDMMENGLLEQGRLLKESAGCMFYDPAALVAFCRFNFLLRRAFIRLLHADLSAIRTAVNALEAKGIKAVDCRRAGFSAAETTAKLRSFCENWRQPFQKDYTQSSVSHAFEQLLALRADLEEALGISPADPHLLAPLTSPKPSASASEKPESTVEPIQAQKTSAPPTVRQEHDQNSAAVDGARHMDASTKPVLQGKASGSTNEISPPSATPMDAEKCVEAIWEQLIALQPSRGRSMATVVLQDTKVLLSAWEVAAFLSAAGQESEDVRRAVVARALLAVATDQRRRSGNEQALDSALSLARCEVSYFQGRLEDAKRAKNTEAAVNLGISTKRLLSFMEEAEKLQP
jgi:hypothetical protein